MPTLRPGEIVIMDNLSAHKPLSFRAAIDAAGAFAQLKAIPRKTAARSINSLWNAIRDALLPALTPTLRANYFTAAGYERE